MDIYSYSTGGQKAEFGFKVSAELGPSGGLGERPPLSSRSLGEGLLGLWPHPFTRSLHVTWLPCPRASIRVSAPVVTPPISPPVLSSSFPSRVTLYDPTWGEGVQVGVSCRTHLASAFCRWRQDGLCASVWGVLGG